MPIIVFVVVFLSSVFSTGQTIYAAPETCASNYSCTDTQIVNKDCIPKTTNGCVKPGGGTGSYCCRNNVIVEPTPATTCVSNGNYCVGTSTECFPGDLPNQGGTCPGTGICCQVASTTPSPPGGSSGPYSTPLPIQDPQSQGFKNLFDYPCNKVSSQEFNPLRPYPGSPCDELIPKAWPEKDYISFACGKSANVGGDVSFPRRVSPVGVLPANPVADTPYWCDASRSQVCYIKQSKFDVTINLAGAKIPILGNTQDPNLNDSARVNQYLLSYLTGTVQQAEQVPLRASAITYSAASSTPVPSSASLKILPLGDSITGGYYICSLTKLFPKSTLIGPNDGSYCSSVKHAGYGSAATFQILEKTKVDEWLPFVNQATHVLIHLGTNDIYDNGKDPSYTEEDFRINLTAIVMKIKSRNPSATVILAKIIPNKFNSTQKWNGSIAQVAQETGSVLVDAGAGFDINTHLADEVHPNAAGGEVIANNFAAGINGQSIPTSTTSTGSISAIDRLINYSGPLKKLLSFDSQNKIKTDLTMGPIGSEYHNYSLGCQKNLDLDYIRKVITQAIPDTISGNAFFLEFVGKVIVFIPTHIDQLSNLVEALSYVVDHGNLTGYTGSPDILSDADNVLQDAISIYGYAQAALAEFTSALRTISLDFAESCDTSPEVKRLEEMAQFPPPDPDNFSNFSSYWKAYQNWKYTLGAKSLWGELFEYVPFSTLEDTMGEFTISLIQEPNHQPPGVILNDPSKPITLTIKSADSRLSFPHVRAIDALAGLLQRISSPKDPKIPTPEFNQSGHIPVHQEAKDGPSDQPNLTLKQVGPPGNSSVVAGEEPPFPLFTSHDSVCDLKDVRINAGDTLYGNEVTASLSYYQKFSYTPDNSNIVPDPTKLKPGEVCTDGNQCQTGNCLPKNLLGQRYCSDFTTGTVELPTEARIAVFSKTPLIDKIYDKLVAGKASILRRFIASPSCAPDCSDEQKKSYIRQDGSTIPAAIDAAYTGTGVTAGDKTGGGQIYIARLGSLFDYFLGGSNQNMNLQKALRPKGASVSNSGTFGTVTGGTCNDVAKPVSTGCSAPGTSLVTNYACGVNSAMEQIIEKAGSFAGVPPDILTAILSIETRNGVFNLTSDEIARHSTAQASGNYSPYLCEPNACGAMGAMQLLTGVGVQPSCSQATGIDRWTQYGGAVVEACAAPSGYAPNPGNVRDSVFAGAKMVKAISGSSTSSNWSRSTVYRVANSYYGTCSQTFDLGAFMNYANSCLPILPSTPQSMTYCDYLWLYYKARNPGAQNN